MVALLVIGGLFLFVFPSQAYLSQQRELDGARHDVAVLREQNERLAEEAQRLQDPAEVERIARERFGMTRPGEQAFAVVPVPRETTAEADDGPDGAAP